MKSILKKIKTYLIFLIVILIIVMILSLLNSFGVSKSITNILSIISTILLFLIIGYTSGKKCEKKGYIEGIKKGTLLVLILIIIGLITFDFSFKTIIYYSILVLTTIFGAMLGINKKK